MKRIIIIPSIQDPRHTVANIASFQSEWEEKIPIVVIYGTCPNVNRAKGEGGKPIRNWTPQWNQTKIGDIREDLNDLVKHNVPIYFFDDLTQDKLWKALDMLADGGQLPREVNSAQFKKCVEGIFSGTYNYGAQRNKGFIVANNFSAAKK